MSDSRQGSNPTNDNREDGFGEAEWIEACSSVEGGEGSLFSMRTSVSRAIELFWKHQAELRERSRRKFSDPDRWLWTRKLLEQASDEQSAALIAEAYPEGSTVWDLCCGAGADSVAIGRRTNVNPIDNNPIAVAIANSNLRQHSLSQRVECRDVVEFTLPSDAYVHIDPDRRPGNQRATKLDYLQPGPEFLERLVRSTRGGSMKLAPATRELTRVPQSMNSVESEGVTASSLTLRRFGVQFISRHRSVTQQRWWWNMDRYPMGTTTISSWRNDRGWSHWTCQQSSEKHSDVVIDEWDSLGNLGGFIGDTDPAVRASGLNHVFAADRSVSTLGSRQGYLWSESWQSMFDSPLIDWFQIDSVLPLDVKKLRKHLRECRIGNLEIKTRAVDVDLEGLRSGLKLQGGETRTLLLTRIGKRTAAILATRVEKLSEMA